MYVIASFEHSAFLELAITDLEQKGLPRTAILAVPLSVLRDERRLFDTIHRADGASLLDGAAVLGTVGMSLGVIFGFIWAWGPIIWGLIGLFAGCVLGFVLDYANTRRSRRQRTGAGGATEVVVIVSCEARDRETVERVLWEHMANAIGRLD